METGKSIRKGAGVGMVPSVKGVGIGVMTGGKVIIGFLGTSVGENTVAGDWTGDKVIRAVGDGVVLPLPDAVMGAASVGVGPPPLQVPLPHTAPATIPATAITVNDAKAKAGIQGNGFCC